MSLSKSFGTTVNKIVDECIKNDYTVTFHSRATYRIAFVSVPKNHRHKLNDVLLKHQSGAYQCVDIQVTEGCNDFVLAIISY